MTRIFKPSAIAWWNKLNLKMSSNFKNGELKEILSALFWLFGDFWASTLNAKTQWQHWQGGSPFVSLRIYVMLNVDVHKVLLLSGPSLSFLKILHFWATLLRLGVKVRNMKMDLNIYGTWRWVGQWTLMMKRGTELLLSDFFKSYWFV